MVLLTMTQSIVDGLNKIDDDALAKLVPNETDPSVTSPAIGNPISHGQIIDLWKVLRGQQQHEASLERLLRGSSVYIPPPPPKKEPTAEFKALMARLRHDEDARAYERMVNPPKLESFSERFPAAAHSYAEVNRPSNAIDAGDDEVTLNEVHRQVMLIINFMVSIVGVGGTLWVLSRWWNLPARIFLTMGGSILVAIAEVAVYNGYVWRMGQAKKKEAAAKETKEIMNTWVVGEEEDMGAKGAVLIQSKEDADAQGTARRRNKLGEKDGD